ELVPIAPTPTFSKDTFTFNTSADGWIESNTRSFIDFFLTLGTTSKLALGNRMRMLTSIHDTLRPPDYPYTRALSAHSAAIQLYARSGQLPTLESRSKVDSAMCRLGCCVVESMHHIFVECIYFADWRRDAATELLARTALKLTEAGVPEEAQPRVLQAPKSFSMDDAVIWPL
ncbi:hypothetical protein B0H13DRAFT_1460358, partial [Mycena leptocephala]